MAFGLNQTAQATVDAVLANIANLTLDKIVSWNMLIGDLDEILNGRHFGTDAKVHCGLVLSLDSTDIV